MPRRLALGLFLVFLLVLATPAAADDLHQRKHSVDAKISRLEEQVAQTRRREESIKTEIGSFTVRIRGLERQVGDVSTRLVPLERELQLRELKLNRLNALYQLQSDRLTFLRRQYTLALQRLNARIVAIYEADDADSLGAILSSSSFADVLDGIDYVRQIGVQDKRISEAVGAAKVEVRRELAQTRRTRAAVLSAARVMAVRVAQVRALREQLIESHSRLAGVRAQKRASLESLTKEEREEIGEIDALAEVSRELTAKIQAAQAARAVEAGVDSTPSGAGFIWPVAGPVTSPFGWRWGRMHEGIDIAASYGAPIAAAAGGTVIYAGWLGGYGNLVVIDHGNGLSTAYAHQSSIAVSGGQSVAQGQTIGYVGSTGHSFGPHVHFEVRVNGAPVDPLGYL